MMKDSMNSSSSSNSYASNSSSGSSGSQTPNSSIHCTVSNCTHHCQDQNYCGLNAVQIGTHESNPTKTECVDCNSFQMK